MIGVIRGVVSSALLVSVLLGTYVGSADGAVLQRINLSSEAHSGRLPAARDLLRRMESVFRSQPSYRVRGTLFDTGWVAHKQPVVTLIQTWGAISSGARREEERIHNVRGVPSHGRDSTYLVAGNRSASRLTTAGAWQCSGPLDVAHQFFAPLVLNPREVVMTLHVLGATTVAGQAAWHLRLRLHLRIPVGRLAAQRTQADEYIALRTDRLLRETQHDYVDYGTGFREWIDGSMTFTDYGDPVKVTLPPACAGSKR